MRRRLVWIVAALATMSTTASAQERDQSDCEEQIDRLEKRIKELESKLPKASPTPSRQGVTLTKKTSRSIVGIKLTNKRFQNTDAMAGVYEEAIWWDAEYSGDKLARPTRAIKGTIEFADLFGEVKFRLKNTVNKPLSPGGTVRETGVGFNYNQFISSHKWMRGTDLKDMKIQFNVEAIIYEDGTTESIK